MQCLGSCVTCEGLGYLWGSPTLMGSTHTYGAEPHLWGRIGLVGLSHGCGAVFYCEGRVSLCVSLMGQPHTYGVDSHLWGSPTLMGRSHTYGSQTCGAGLRDVGLELHFGSRSTLGGPAPHLGVSSPTGRSHPTLMGLPHISGTGTNKALLTELQCVGPNVPPPPWGLNGVLWVSS